MAYLFDTDAISELLRPRHLTNVEERVLPVVTVLPYDVPVARIFGRIRSSASPTSG